MRCRDILNPTALFPASKAASDHLVRARYHTWPAGGDHQCSNNYGYHFEADPADDRQRARRQAAADLRRWPERARLAVRDRPRRDPRAVLAGGRLGETYQYRRLEREAVDIVNTVCAMLDELRPDPAGSYSRLISYVKDRPGHDRRYAIDARKVERELGWRPAETFERHPQDRRVVSRRCPGWVANVQSGAYREWVARQYA